MVAGLGGVFIYSENPKVLADWYTEHLGLAYEYTENHQAYYVTFPYLERNSQRERYTIFSILHNADRPLVAGKAFTINLRVENMEALLGKLRDGHVEVRGPEFHEEGTFAWINDIEGNFIELWEDNS